MRTACRLKAASNPLNDNFSKKEFQELWNSINFKHAYTVHFNDDELRRHAIDNIDKNLSVSKVAYRMVTGEQREQGRERELAGGEHFAIQHSETHDLSAAGPVHVKYDLVGEVARRAHITRKSAAAILSGMSKYKFRLFQDNPEEFIAKVSAAIVDEKATMIVDHISYDRLSERYDSAIFTEDMPENLSRAYHAKKNVQDYVFPDGAVERSVERRFAEDLDAADEVVVYAKLPRAFRFPRPWVATPLTGPSRLSVTLVKHVFFIAETKGSMRSMQLRGVEKAKIDCARKLFNSMNDADVRYDAVDSYESLLELVRG